jgi:hypothetical protein
MAATRKLYLGFCLNMVSNESLDLDVVVDKHNHNFSTNYCFMYEYYDSEEVRIFVDKVNAMVFCSCVNHSSK